MNVSIDEVKAPRTARAPSGVNPNHAARVWRSIQPIRGATISAVTIASEGNSQSERPQERHVT